MKNTTFSLTLLLTVLFAASSFAQQSGPASQPSKDNSTVTTSSPKDVWLKNYREIKPKVDSYIAKMKQVGSDHPDFSREVKQLNEMVADFKTKIDHFDNATKDERAHYAETMKQFYKRINEREAKVKDEWNKIHSSSNDRSKSDANESERTPK